MYKKFSKNTKDHPGRESQVTLLCCGECALAHSLCVCLILGEFSKTHRGFRRGTDLADSFSKTH